MSHHDETIPMSVFDPNADDGAEIEVSFDWTPDTGTGEEFYLVSSSADRAADKRILTWLDENWTRPDRADDEADYRRDLMMEARHDD